MRTTDPPSPDDALSKVTLSACAQQQLLDAATAKCTNTSALKCNPFPEPLQTAASCTRHQHNTTPNQPRPDPTQPSPSPVMCEQQLCHVVPCCLRPDSCAPAHLIQRMHKQCSCATAAAAHAPLPSQLLDCRLDNSACSCKTAATRLQLPHESLPHQLLVSLA